MSLIRLNPEGLDPPLGQYSHVTRARAAAGDFVFVAGQLHFGPDLQSQCDGIFRQIAVALASAKADWRHVAQFTTYLVDPDLIPHFMNWRLKNFPTMFGNDGYPPNTLLVVSRLVDPDFLVEVQTLAVVPA